MRKIIIKVLFYKNDMVFEVGGLKIDCLKAHVELIGGELTVQNKQGVLIAKTYKIDWYGTHGECPAFYGPKSHSSAYIQSEPLWLYPQDFKEGDLLIIKRTRFSTKTFREFIEKT
ncbi:MAG: hypothetical protein AAB840_01760, partial [Patescibacteria group bacterium]